MPTRFNFLDEVSLPKSPGLSRRKSLLSRPSNSRNAPFQGKEDLVVSTCIDPSRSGPRLPMEMLDEIVKSYFEIVVASGRDSQRAVFSRDIKPLTIVSTDFRFLILRQFCRNLGFLTLRDAKGLFDYLTSVVASLKLRNWTGGFTWVRTLSMPAFLLPRSIFVLKQFENLRDLVIDCSHCILSSQIITLSRLFDALSDEDNLVPNLRSFIMTNVPRLDDSLLKTIAATLPQVVNLHVSTVEGIEMGCCRNCYEESLNRVLHSPIYDIYRDGEDMAEKITLALKGFRNLKNLHLGILLSSCDLLDKHTKHDGTSNARPRTVKSIPYCPRCVKYAKETIRRELSTGLAIASRLSSLETISWATAFSLGSSEDGKVSEENCVQCDVNRFPDSLQYSIINAAQHDHAEALDDGHWKIACFAVQRTKDKIRLLRTTKC